MSDCYSPLGRGSASVVAASIALFVATAGVADAQRRGKVKSLTHSVTAGADPVVVGSTTTLRSSGAPASSSDPSGRMVSVGNIDNLGTDDVAEIIGRYVHLLLFDEDQLVAESRVLVSIGSTGNDLAYLGDVDGDGVCDLAVSTASEIKIFFLTPAATERERVSILAGVGGAPNVAWFGRQLSRVGDVDGNGVPDLVASGRNANNVHGVYLLFLSSSGSVESYREFSKDVGFESQFFSPPSSFGAGASINSLGDLNGDGIEELAVAQPGGGYSYPLYGAVWILFLKPDGTLRRNRVARLDETQLPHSSVEGFAAGVLGPGDVNGDGTPDLVVISSELGAHAVTLLPNGYVLGDATVQLDWGLHTGASLGDSGSGGPLAVVLSGEDVDGDHNREVVLLDASGGIDYSHTLAQTNTSYGHAAGAIGDLDGDGIPELALGAPQDRDGAVYAGAAWIHFFDADGKHRKRKKISSRVGWVPGLLVANERFGAAVAGAGDLDGDGIPDLVVGAPFYYSTFATPTNPGSIWLLYLMSDGSVRTHVQVIGGSAGFSGAVEAGDRFGSSVANLGDLNGDGVTDFAVGAIEDDSSAPGAGAVWILLMRPDGTVLSHMRIVQGAGGFTGLLEDDAHFGSSLAGLGDVDGDGVPDLAASSPGDNELGQRSGAVWILFLREDGTVKSERKHAGIYASSPLEKTIPLARARDLDGLGRTTLAVGLPNAGLFGAGARMWTLNPNGSIAVDAPLPIARPRSMAFAGDIDADGIGELVGTNTVYHLDGVAVVDFETDDDLVTAVSNGRAVTSAGSLPGAARFDRSIELDGAPTSGLTAAIFDSDPAGPNGSNGHYADPDLLVGRGNILVLQEDACQTTPGVYDIPDDDRLGGDFDVTFNGRGVALLSLDLIDIDDTPWEGATLILTDAKNKVRVYTIPAGWTEDITTNGPTGVRTLDLTTTDDQPGFVAAATAKDNPGFDQVRVVRLQIHFKSSGALDQIRYDPYP